MVLWYHLNLTTGCVGSGPFGRCRPRLAIARNLSRVTGYKLQSDLQMIATCSENGSAWEKLNCKMRSTAIVPGFGLLSKRYGVYCGQMLLVWGL